MAFGSCYLLQIWFLSAIVTHYVDFCPHCPPKSGLGSLSCCFILGGLYSHNYRHLRNMTLHYNEGVA